MNKILMIERGIDTLRALEERFLHAGFETLFAYDGRHGFEMAKNTAPDLIITDANTPVMSGFEMCKAIKLDQDTKSIPIVVMTDKFQPQESFLSLGIKDFINKPISVDELFYVVKNKFNCFQAAQVHKNRILISGKPEILLCAEGLLKRNPHWAGYFCCSKDSFLRDAIKYSPDVIFMDLLMQEMFWDEIILKLKLIPELENTDILTYYSSSLSNRQPYAIQAEMIEVQYMQILTEDAGATEYLGPFNPLTFVKLIDIYRRYPQV